MRRRAARRGLIEFTEFGNKAYRAAAHHRLIAEKLEAVARGDIDRLMINMPPRHGKSELASRRFPAWYLGNHPDATIISASYNDDKATEFGGEVRDIVRAHEYRTLFPNVELKEDTRAKGFWRTGDGGYYISAGVGTALTGRGTVGPIVLIDDPLKDRAEADSERRRETVWSWYSSTVLSRFPKAIIVVQCMTGDTPVLMASGVEKPLRDVRPGDRVATYDDGKIAVSVVRNWINHGPDSVFKIRMKSGIIVKANARHPFLVDEGGETKWQRTATLKKGSAILRVIGANGAALSARQMDAKSLQSAKACATPTTIKQSGAQGLDRLLSILKRGAKRTFDIVTELTLKSTSAFLQNKAACAPFASSLRTTQILGRIGGRSFASITATTAKKLEGFFATTAISQSGTESLRKSSSPQPHTYEIVRDTVVEVSPCGAEDVFDIEVERTENFIAGGLVSHNTRWHEDDLTGRLLEEQAKGGDQWTILELPAISPDGKALWPDFYPLEALERVKRASIPRDWSALYQQRPTPDEGAYFKRDWFRWYTEKPKQLRIYGASDYAVTDGGGDWTVHLVVGVDPDDNVYVLDLWRGQTTSDQWVQAWLDMVRLHKPLMWVEEQGQIIKSIGPFIDKRMREERVYCRREQVASAHDKPTRSRSIQARTSMGKVYLPEKAPWVNDFVSELLMFPAGKHDDMVDTYGLIGRMIDELLPAGKPKVPTASSNAAGYRKLTQDRGADEWRTL